MYYPSATRGPKRSPLGSIPAGVTALAFPFRVVDDRIIPGTTYYYGKCRYSATGGTVAVRLLSVGLALVGNDLVTHAAH